MKRLIDRFKTTEKDPNASDTQRRTVNETKWAIESITEQSFEWDDGSTFLTVEWDKLKELQSLGAYSEDTKNNRAIKILKRFPDVFKATVVVYIEDDEISIELHSIFYALEELRNEPIGEFSRWIGYRGPRVEFDIEQDNPKIIAYAV